MAQPQTKDDTVLYEPENIYGDKDITIRMLDGSILNVWGEVFVNGNPISAIGMIPIATQPEAEAGTNNSTAMTPLRTSQAIDAQVDYVWVGPNAPTDPTTEVWWDSDDTSVYIPPSSTVEPVNASLYGYNKSGVIAALQAAEARGKGTVVYFPAGVYELDTGLSLSGYSVQIRGDGAAGTLAIPKGTVFKASTQNGPVLDFTGYLQPDAFHGRVTHSGFWVQGSNVADPTKNNSGIRLSSMGSATFSDIAVARTGGPCWEHVSPAGSVYLCDFERIILTTPVSAKANDVPYMIMKGSNGNRFRGFGLRSVSTSADVGASGAVILVDDGTYAPHDNLFDTWWVEYLHIPTNGTIFHFAANGQILSNLQVFDCSKEVGATNTSHIRFVPPAISDFGGNLVTGPIPGKGTGSEAIDMGIDMRQNRNSIRGVKGYNGTNVVIAAGITNIDVDLGGSIAAGINAAVVDNSGSNTQRYQDTFLRTEVVGPWLRDTGTNNRNGPRFIDRVTPTEGSVHLGTGGIRMVTTGVGRYDNADSITLRNLAGTGASKLYFGTLATHPYIYSSTGTPEGVLAAPIGSLFLRQDGGANTSLYVKESGTGNTGWVAK